MEEKKLPTDEQVEQHLSKEEILERSRKENAKAGDEREQKLLNNGLFVMLMVGAAVLLLVYLVNLICFKIDGWEIIAIFFVMGGVSSIWQGIFGKKLKKAFLVVGIMQLTASIAFLVLWILPLVA